MIGSFFQLVYIHSNFLLQSSLAMAISLDQLLIFSGRLQVLIYIHIDSFEAIYIGALKHVLVENSYSWNLWEECK